MPDVPAAAMGAAAVYCFWRWLKRPQWLEVIIAGVVLGLAELCKFTLLIFYPLLPVMWLVYRLPEWRSGTIARREWLRQGGMLSVMFLLSIYIINCGYLFAGTFTPLERFRFQTAMFTGHESLDDVPPEGGNRFAGTWLGELPMPLPANMVQGIDTQRYDFERGLPSYVHGQWADHGWWYYYLYALAVKMPLGTWCLVLLAIGVTVFGRGYNAPWRDEMVVLAPGLAILIFVSSQTGFSVHSRYVIPALPFFFIWASKLARVFSNGPHLESLFPRARGSWRRLGLAAAVVVALTWSVGSSLWTYPHSLSYFNELAGEPKNGGRHLLDSNIDWGQDLLYLKGWLDKHPEVKLDGLAYWSSYPATLAGIPETPMPPPGSGDDASNSQLSNGAAGKDPSLSGTAADAHSASSADGSQDSRTDTVHAAPSTNASGEYESLGPQPGWYALSVNYLYSCDRQYRYFLDHFTPVASAGYSIYLYHITLDEANLVRRELGLPELPNQVTP